MRKILTGLTVACLLAGCSGEVAPDAKEAQSNKGAQLAESVLRGSGRNAEQENIAARLRLTMNPGQIGFILLMNEAGQPIAYYGVKGKITSGGKRLSKPFEAVCCDGAYRPAPSDEGTWGDSAPYIFFWTTDGQYIQWNGAYLYSDKPFRTRVAPLVIAIEAP